MVVGRVEDVVDTHPLAESKCGIVTRVKRKKNVNVTLRRQEYILKT